MVLGSAALLAVSRLVPATSLTLTAAGLAVVLLLEMRRRRRLAPLPV